MSHLSKAIAILLGVWAIEGMECRVNALTGSSPQFAIISSVLAADGPGSSDDPSANNAERPANAARPDNRPAANDGAVRSKDASPPSTNSPRSDAATTSEFTDEDQVRIRLAAVQRAIERDERQLADLKAELANPHGEYVNAHAAFKEIDLRLTKQELHLKNLPVETSATEKGRLDQDLLVLKTQRTLAKKRLELAIAERQILEIQIGTLERKNQQDRNELLRLIAGDSPAAQPAGPPVTASAEATTHHGSSSPTTVAAPSPLPATPGRMPPLPSLTMPANVTSGSTTEKPSLIEHPSNTALIKAREDAQEKTAAADAAKSDAHTVAARMETQQAYIREEMKRLAIARQKEDNALESRFALDKELQQELEEGTAAEQLAKLRHQRDEQEQRFHKANGDVAEATQRLNEMQAELSSLVPLQQQAQKQFEKKLHAAEAAHNTVKRLQNPYAFQNIQSWIMHQGAMLLLILLTCSVLLWGANIIQSKLEAALIYRAQRGGRKERETRAETLVGVGYNAAKVIIIFWGVTMSLAQLGVDLGVVMGGAAVVGLAVAFGAQNLIRDYFYGFVILLENQFRVNDVVRIGTVGGLVERFTLRITALRDDDGTLHFIPNGQITMVSNMTHGWSQAVFNIPIAYGEDVDRAIDMLTQLARELRTDPEYSLLILDDPEMLGVDNLGESSVIIKFTIKTRPLKLWTVKREMLRRIKRRFDELRIEIPPPQRIVYHRQEIGGMYHAPWGDATSDVEHDGHDGRQLSRKG